MPRRSATFLIAGIFAAAGLAFAELRSGDHLLFNHSASLRVGFYYRIDEAPGRASIVTVRAGDVAPEDARQRGFDEAHNRFIKRVAAIEGDVACAREGIVTINGLRAAVQQSADTGGRPLHHWIGCRALEADEYFLLGDTSDSFDSRYWGPVHRTQIEGVWRRL